MQIPIPKSLHDKAKEVLPRKEFKKFKKETHVVAPLPYRTCTRCHHTHSEIKDKQLECWTDDGEHYSKHNYK